MDTFYTKLMALPLFKGMSYDKIAAMVGRVRLHFLKFPDGEAVIRPGDVCDALTFLFTGRARLSMESENGMMRVSMTLTAPEVVAPSFLFGRSTVYPCQVTASGPCAVVRVAKNEVLDVVRADEVCLINYLNMLATRAQMSAGGVMALTGGSLSARIVFWLLALTQSGATDILLECRKRDLYMMFGVTRSSYMAELERLESLGLIEIRPNAILAPDRRALAAALPTL